MSLSFQTRILYRALFVIGILSCKPSNAGGARLQMSGLSAEVAHIDLGWLNTTLSGFYLIGAKTHFLEIHGGLMGSLLEANEVDYWFVIPVLGANYRWRSPQQKWTLRMGPILLIGAQVFRPMDWPVQPWLNASVGYHFK